MAEDKEDLHHDENTLRKVYEGLLKAGIFGQQAVDAVSEMQNQGILFRERKPKRRGRPPRKEIEERLKDSKYGPAYVDPNEEVAKDPGPAEIGQTQAEIDAAWKPEGGADAKSPDA